MKRGRKSKPPPGGYTNRLRERREARGWSLEEFGRRADMEPQRIQRYEINKRKLTLDLIYRFARVLECSPADLLNDAPETVPLRFVAAAFDAEFPGRQAGTPGERVPAPFRLGDLADVFAVETGDDHADRLYPPGSWIFCRPPAAVAPLRAGDIVVIRRHLVAGDPNTLEVFVGRLQRGATGDIEVVTPSSNRLLPNLVTVRRAAGGSGLAERFATYTEADSPFIDYQPQPGDLAEIVGVAVWDCAPRRR